MLSLRSRSVVRQRALALVTGVAVASGFVLNAPSALAEPANSASVDQVREAHADDQVRAEQIDDHTAVVETSQGSVTAVADVDSDEVVVTSENGQTTSYPLPNGEGEETYAGVSCSMLIWAVDIIRGAGWTAGIAAVAATGPAGAVLLATMYAMGSSAFLAWVGTKC